MEINNKINNNDKKDSLDFLNEIFFFSKDEQKYYPILIIKDNNSMVELFNFLISEDFINIEKCLNCILNVFKQSLEITFQFCSLNNDFNDKRNYNFIKLLIDLYMKIEDKKNLELIISLITFLFKNIDIKKNIYDYPLNNLLKDYKKENLTSVKIIKYIDLLSLLYNFKNNEITIQPKNYFYFTDNSHFGINIKLPSPNIQIDNGFSIEISFYINEYKKNEKSVIFELFTEDDNKFNVLLNENDNLVVFYNSKLIDCLSIPIKKGIWNKMKFILTTSKRKNYPEINIYVWDINNILEYRNYQLETKFLNEVELSSINFFQFFEGKFTSIIFYSGEKEDNNNNDYPYGIYSRKQLIEFYKKNNKKEYLIQCPIFFILSPISFNKKNYIITDPVNRIKGKFPKPLTPKNYNNFVKLYHKTSNNIFNLGGINILLPIIEIIYKNFQQKECFISIINFINNIIKQKNKSLINVLTSNFFSMLSLFLERINDNLYNSEVIKLLVEIGHNILNFKDEKFKLLKKEFFTQILFNTKIIKKYPPNLLNELWEQTPLNYNSLKEIFPSLTSISSFLSSYYSINNIDKNLFKILLVILNHKGTNDEDRVNFFKILSNESISINLILTIIDLFTNFFQSNENNKALKQNSLIYMLEYNCLNELIFCLSNSNLQVKIKIIDFMIFMSSEYYQIIKNFFEKCQVKNPKKIKYKYLGKKDILQLIQYNIIINENNEKSKSEFKMPKTQNNFFLERSESVILDIENIKSKFLNEINNEPLNIKKTSSIIIEKKKKKKKEEIIINKKEKKIKEKISESDLSFDEKSPTTKLKESQNKLVKNFTKQMEFDLEIEEKEEKHPLTSKNSKKSKFTFSIEATNELMEKKENKNPIKKTKSKSTNSILKELHNNNESNILIPFKKTKSETINFDYSTLEINVDKINKESELKLKDFPNKVFSLAKHCVDFLNGIDDENECKNYQLDIFSYDNDKTINKTKALKTRTIDTIKEDENENCISNTISKRNTFNDNSPNNNLVNLIKKNSSSITIDENNFGSNNKRNDINLTPKDFKIESPVKIDNKELENNNFHIATSLCGWLYSIKKNININSFNFDNNYVLDFLVFQCIKLKNIKMILNIICFLSSNKPMAEISVQNNQNEIWKNDIQIYFRNENVIHFIIDVAFNCFLHIHIPHFKSPLINSDEKFGNANYYKTYFGCKDLLIDIYFNNLNYNEQKNSNSLIFGYLFPYLLNFRFNKKYNKDGIYNNYSFTFFRELINEIIGKFYEMFYRKEESNFEKKIKNNEFQGFIKFISLFFEFAILFQNSDKIYTSSSNLIHLKEQNISNIPSYIISNVYYSASSDKIWSDYNNYHKIYNIIKYIWSRKRIYDLCSIKYEDNDYKVYHISNEEIDKIINCLILNKDNFNYSQSYFEILFNSHNIKIKDKNDKNMDYFLPLINSISIFTSYLIQSISRKEEILNLQFWLNEYQYYIIFLLIGSCTLSHKKKILEKYEYKFVTSLICSNLAFIIGFVFSNFYNENNKEIKSLYHILIQNISRIFSKIIKITEEKNNNKLFSKINFMKKLDLNDTPIFLLNNYYKVTIKKMNENIPDNNEQKNIKEINIIKSIFTIKDFNSKDYMSTNYLNENKQMFEEKLFYNQEMLENIDLIFNIEMYYNIFNYEYNQNFNIQSILNEEDTESITYTNNYKKLYENIINDYNYLQKCVYEKNEYQTLSETLNNKKKYRKLKKELFSWNNTYSDFNTFYLNKNSLKYKLKYHLTKDLTTPLIVPILDLQYYFPNFLRYDKSKIFEENYRNYYNIDLKVFPKETPSVSIIDHNDFECCFITQTNHIKGGIKIYYEKIEFIPIISNDENIIFSDRDEEYQSEKKNCYGSIFKTNNNYKDYLFIRIIEINNINFIFKRKYCYRDNSIEIFLNTNKSFFIKFKTYNAREDFINKIISQKKNSFAEIKSIDKKVIIGYYKNIPKYKDIYSNIDNLSHKWRNWRISNLEYLMWLNIYGNRSYRDLNQYPVMPWILTNYLKESNEFNEVIQNEKKTINNNINNYLINNYLRDFNCPIGLFCSNPEEKKRKELYIDTYKSMVLDLTLENLIELNQNDKEELELNTELNNNEIETKKQNSLKTYGIDIENIYKNININYEKIPYYFGSHFSNATYVSHYLVRIFPYTLTSIEIQLDDFDAPDRLFFNLGKTFKNVSSEKCDVRELIPQFFCLPEMFENKNKLNLGYLQYDNESKEFFNEKDKEKFKIEDVHLPIWAKDNRNIFVMKMREILEDERLKINYWIDLIFGNYQRGNEALKIGNLFCSYSYDNVMIPRIDNYIKNNQIEEANCIFNLFELGVHPNKIIKNEKERKEKKKDKSELMNNKFYYFRTKCKIINDGNNKLTQDPIFISSYKTKTNNFGIENLMVLLSNFENYQISFDKTKVTTIENNDNINIKSESKLFYKIFESKELLYKVPKIISLKNNSYFIISGFINGEILLLKNEENNKEIKQYEEIRKSNPLISKKDNSLITYITKDNDEEFIYVGTENGSIIIYKIEELYNSYSIIFFRIKKNHTEAIININANSRLNMFIDCSLDCFINIYTMTKVELIKSIYNDNSYGSLINYVFLSSSPLPSFIYYTNKNMFNCYNINGELLDIICEENFLQNKDMINPIIFTDSNFMDYLIYGTISNFLFIRKFPNMNLMYYININQTDLIETPLYSNIDNDTFDYKPIKFIHISNNGQFIYVIYDNSNLVLVLPLNLNLDSTIIYNTN